MEKIVKLTQKQLRGLIAEAAKKATIKEVKQLTRKALSEASLANDPILRAYLDSQELTEDDAENANKAATGLDQLVRVFYGSPWEKKFYELQGLCSAVVMHYERWATGGEDHDGENGDDHDDYEGENER